MGGFNESLRYRSPLRLKIFFRTSLAHRKLAEDYRTVLYYSILHTRMSFIFEPMNLGERGFEGMDNETSEDRVM